MCHRSIESCANCRLQAICGGKDQAERLGVRRGHLNAGQAVFTAGQKPAALFALRSGSIKEVLLHRCGVESIVQLTVPGEVVGLGAFTSGISPTSAIALTRSEYCRIPLATLAQLTDEVPRLGRELLQMVSEKLNATNAWFAAVYERPAVHRVASFVLDVSTRLTAAGMDGSRIRFGFSRRDIATHLGITVETVSRSLQDLRRRSLIAIRSKELSVPSTRALREFAESAVG